MLTAAELAEIDAWRARQEVATRSDAIRRMVQNSIRLEQDLAEIMDEAEDVYDEASLSYDRMWDTRMQQIGRHPELPQRTWSAEELIDREIERSRQLFDQMHSLYLLLLKLNNRVMSISNAKHLRAGRAAARREIEELEQERAEFLAKVNEGSVNRRLFQAFAWLTDRDFFGEKEKWDELPDDEQERRIQVAMDHLELLAERAQVAADDEEIKRRKSLEPRDEDLAAVIAYQAATSPDKPVEWHLERLRDHFKDANPAVAGSMIRAALAAHLERDGDDVSS